MTREPRRFDRSMAWLARARQVVPGASQTLSKGPSMFVEGAYPVFLDRGQGCRVWDVDGNEYVDYIMGLASITLGYAYPAVTEAVARQLERGSIFSLPHPLEVEVAERLRALIPCAQMARFLKTGSEADAAAVRVARAATGRDVLIVAGYLGWQDWYAVTTPRSSRSPRSAAAVNQFIAPRDLCEPARWSASALMNTERPARRSSSADRMTGVRWIRPINRSDAAAISAASGGAPLGAFPRRRSFTPVPSECPARRWCGWRRPWRACSRRPRSDRIGQPR